MATLCAARLGNSEEIKKLGAKVSLISFGQPRVGDANFKTLFEKKKENANNNEDNYCMDGYLRIVNEQDVFARVPPKSGIWIPEDVLETSLSSSIDAKQWTYQYEHAGDCVWYRRRTDFISRGTERRVVENGQSNLNRVRSFKVREIV